ncbi:hypothetical protein [Melaminivora sp.]|uniref:hypothetical protein n=1 Tax=Melaminivora sp. TaxID=1933032 RepID=UPI0028B09832|nr:hypothetical protein [Melaminivora sp.]
MELVSIQSEADWLARSAFVPELRMTLDDLQGILSGYDLPRVSGSKQGVVRCGVNGCNRLHYKGFLLKLKDGRETIMGWQCGARDLGLDFKEFQTSYVERKRQADQRAAVAAAIAEAHLLAAHAGTLVEPCREALEYLLNLRGSLQRHTAFWDNLKAVAKMDGRVLRELKRADERSSAKVDVVEAARIHGLAVLFGDMSRRVSDITYTAENWPAEVAGAGRGPPSELKSTLARARKMHETVRDTEKFIRDYSTLRSAIHGMWAVHHFQLRRAGKSNALRRVLERFAGQEPVWAD